MSHFPLFSDLIGFWKQQREVDRLEAMSDHLLLDLGLRRDQLHLLRTTDPKRQREGERPSERRPLGAFVSGPSISHPSIQGCG